MHSFSQKIIADIETPYGHADPLVVKRNILYARIACKWALDYGYIPYASHLFFTQPGILCDSNEEERMLGIFAGKEITARVAQISIFFLDLGESRGMLQGREIALKRQIEAKDIYLFPGEDLRDISIDSLLAKAIEKQYIRDAYSQPGW